MISSYLAKATQEIAQSLETSCVIYVKQDTESEIFMLTVFRDLDGTLRKEDYEIHIKGMPPGSVTKIRELLIEAVNSGIIQKDEKVFVVADDSLGTGFDGLMFISKIDDKFMKLTRRDLQKSVKKSVYEATLEIAKEIGREGREGSRIGTAFIVGDHESVLEKSRQLILNPLYGHATEERSVLNPNFKETIKELAQLDGAFIINDNGTVESACSYIKCDLSGISLPGLGTRHHACAAVTKATNSIAIVVSESGGVVRVFKDGNMILEDPN